MKKFYLIIFILFNGLLFAQSYPSMNINFVANINPETNFNWYDTNTGTRYAGCYGWHNPTDNREYAILGSTTGNFFIDITNPATPVVADFVPGVSQFNLWREIKTYQNYAYLVSDDVNSDLQIVDMSYLPDSVHVVYDSNVLFVRSHTIFVEGTHLYCGGVTLLNNSGYSMALYDISNPVNPVLLRTLNQDSPMPGYVHDMFVRNDTVYASGGNAGLFMFKYDPVANNFTALASFTNYVQAGYNHSSSLTTDGKTLVFADEVPTNTVIKILDVSDFGNLTIVDTIKSNQGATPHNPYVIGNSHVAVSCYQDGVHIFDISNPSNVSESGFFDTDPAHGVNDNFSSADTYQGCWGAYPYLPSGVLLASDMQNGLFILDASQALGIKNIGITESISVYPTPAQDHITLAISSEKGDDLKISLVDVMGKELKSFDQKINPAQNKLQLNVSDVATGCYFLQLQGSSINLVQKIVITK